MYRLSDKAVLFAPPQTIEPEAIQQIENTASMPFIFKHVAVMPDCHYGKGATVGTVLATTGAIIPAAVGVDIGCGMIAVKTSLQRDDIKDPAAMRAGIERRIPMSAGKNNRTLTDTARPRVEELNNLAKRDYNAIDANWQMALGTLGGGNHFIEREEHFGRRVWVTRKGAIEARRGMWAMIPGSMGTRSYIVTGLENPMAFKSAPHGAGRRMSRTKARKTFTMGDLDAAMKGIEFRRSAVLLDEIPSAYKDIDEVMENAKDLVEIKYVLKPFVNVKGD